MPGGIKDSRSKLWSKGKKIDAAVERFTVGDDYVYDNRLVYFDCKASIAHAKMLARKGILKKIEARRLERELNRIIGLHKKGSFTVLPEHEDCHTAIELYLTRRLGALGKKIHTGRSRNDQVLTALRLYYKSALNDVLTEYTRLEKKLLAFLKKYGGIALPGYTHTRKAMPSSVAMWGEGLLDGMKDNVVLIRSVRSLIDQSPAGSGAGYGVPLKIDRKFIAEELGFARVQKNPVYVQLSRGKFERTILHALSQVLFDFNRISSDLILFSMPDFGFFELPDAFTTGSSIMPQKKNPDVLELIRARYHVVSSFEVQAGSMMSNLITGYHRDVQLTKRVVMQSFDITIECIAILSAVFGSLRVNEVKCRDALSEELYATEEVYKLVEQGVPFRDAYRKIAGKYA